MSISLLLADCAEATGGSLHNAGTRPCSLSAFSTDTRTINAGDAFIALTGPNHDGHLHCDTAKEAGAVALVVNHKVDCDLPQLIVPDTRIALGIIARLWCVEHQVPMVAITGSNGKTTVKEMIAAILGELGEVLATQGNLNNDIGVPLTLLRLNPQHCYAVIEMGANHPGEIGYLSKLALPDIAVITNISSAHLEGFGSLENTAAAKSEIFRGVDSSGVAILNADDTFIDVMKEASSHCRQVTVGMLPGADIRGGFIKGRFTINLKGRTIQPDLQLLGQHNRFNAVIAAAVAFSFDVSPDTICRGLESMEAVPGRLQKQICPNGAVIINDTYNANPASTKAALDVLAEYDGKRVFVFGDMKELGDDAIALHADIGNYARKVGIRHFYSVGSLAAHAANAFGESGTSCLTKDDLLDQLTTHADESAVFLVKGSRGAQMEDVVNGLMALDDKDTTAEVTLS